MEAIVLASVAWGFVGGLVAGWWAFRPARFKPLEFEKPTYVRPRGIAWRDESSN